MKHIKVDSCRNCPYRRTTSLISDNDHKQTWCSNADTDGSEIEIVEIIPSWCPLSDAPEWVKIEERLPEEMTDVLAINSKGRNIVVRLEPFYNKEMGKRISWTDGTNWLAKDCFKYWQPLPQPPKEDE